jgi:carboxypeptidase C (cathepsin A)
MVLLCARHAVEGRQQMGDDVFEAGELGIQPGQPPAIRELSRRSQANSRPTPGTISAALVIVWTLSPGASAGLPNDSVGYNSVRAVTTSKHTIHVHGSLLNYTARAGFMPLKRAGSGEVAAQLFFVSYTVQTKPGAPPRPITFYTNGGPGGPATLSYLGPRSLKGAQSEGELPAPPYQMVDNEDTWLSITDLVFIDPVDTGFSRKSASPRSSPYYTPDGDAESIGEFVSLYLEHFEPGRHRPIYVAGHSYATIRSALVADIAGRRGIPLTGIILESSALANQPSKLPVGDPYYILLLPTFTATAFIHNKLSPDLQRNLTDALAQSESWAAKEYPSLLHQGSTLGGAALNVAARAMSRLTGLPPEVVARNQLRFLPDAYLRELLRAEWTPMGLYDSRLVKADEAKNEQDPKSFAVLAELYLHKELRVNSDLPYLYDPFIARYWSCGIDCSADPEALPRLTHAMRENPSLRVMVTNGYFDFVTPYFGTKSIEGDFDSLRQRLTVVFYESGHNPPADVRLRDVATFMRVPLAEAQNSNPRIGPR